MHKSWKPSECDASSGLHRLIGDFVSENHLFIETHLLLRCSDLTTISHLQKLKRTLTRRVAGEAIVEIARRNNRQPLDNFKARRAVLGSTCVGACDGYERQAEATK